MIIKSVLIAPVVIIVITLAARWAVSNYTPEAKLLYQSGDTLNACPDTPNCVSSTFSDDSHYIDAIPGDEETLKALKALVAREERVSIISDTGSYLHAEFRTQLIGYIDDLELLHINGSGKIQIRSASRLGKSDFGVNTKRI